MKGDDSVDNRLIIIGLDGFTFDVLDPYLERGEMPNIKKMIQQGVKGSLQAAIPPVTGPSWVSFMTGNQPGKHGIFDFVTPRPNSIKRRIISFLDIQSPTIWHYLYAADKKVGVVNLPVTYPPPKVDGFIIPGLLTPNTEGEFAYPAGLMKELSRSIGKYVFDVWWQHYGKSGANKFLDRLLFCTEQRSKAMLHLLDNKEWDVFMGVFIGTDRIQHYLWKYIHPETPDILSGNERKIVDRVADFYRQIDTFFGVLLERFGESTDILVISDHGFGPLSKKMFINKWLEKNNYLSILPNRATSKSLKRKLFSILRVLVKLFDPFNLRRKIGIKSKQSGRMSAYDFLDRIDWTKTMAYSASNTEQGIYLNVKGRQPNGVIDSKEEYHRIREEIITKLNSLTDHETGEKLPVEIHRKEDLYDGPYVENAPDIVLFVKNGEYLLDVQLGAELFQNAGWKTGFGTHRKNGVFWGHGPHLKNGVEIDGAKIADLAPTILFHQNVPIPENLDGEAFFSIFNNDFLERQNLSFTKESDHVKEKTEPLSDDEQAELEKKLKGLGYL